MDENPGDGGRVRVSRGDAVEATEEEHRGSDAYDDAKGADECQESHPGSFR